MDREAIRSILPHRGQMLLVDTAILDENQSGEGSGYYTVKGTEFFLDGHFPGNPVVPGVILCEIAAQICGVALGDSLAGKNVVPYFTSMDAVRIRRPVRPGDRFDVKFKLTASKPPFFFFEVEGSVSGEKVLSAKFSFAAASK